MPGGDRRGRAVSVCCLESGGRCIHGKRLNSEEDPRRGRTRLRRPRLRPKAFDELPYFHLQTRSDTADWGGTEEVSPRIT